ncbi:MAG: XRE family transcriptional regulator [Proteobacteria bacterium]|jgi:transcriptional regulator with XRE-family HTH domain|nr:helix-turn-helix transcriptional regulator [Alphaproteobacteria bacterium]NCC02954.1 XRE family transcriptional regulator [Pseudomonadota bacterium]
MNVAAVQSKDKSIKRSFQPDPVDVHVGARLRLRRNLLGLSQEQLGKACGLTFQQIQKYERGTNRMGASRLFQFSKLLDVPVSYFFDDVRGERTAVYPSLGFGEKEQNALEGMHITDDEILYRKETLELIRAYYSISDPKTRRKVYELIKSMSE